MASTTGKVLPVLDASELKSGQMKEVDFGDGKILLSKVGDKVYATSAFCTHYGAPLSKGVMTASGSVKCPWHGACFNVCTGDIEDAPAPAALHSFQTFVKEDGKIYVAADPELTKPEKKSRPPVVRPKVDSDAKSNGGVVIVGGGAGGFATISSLRENGYGGKITLFTEAPHAPIDRTKLSKALVTDASALELASTEDLKTQFGVDVRTGVSVTGIDLRQKAVKIKAGREACFYDSLVLATGAKPKRLPIPGADSDNVYVLREIEDAKKLDAVLKEGKKLVVVGSSFIGMELVVAATGKKMGEIHVIGMTKEPFEPVLGTEVGAGIRKFHESKGVKFHAEAKVPKIEGSKVTVEYASGKTTELDADVIVMAVGVAPATDFVKGSGIETLKDGGIEVDRFLKVKGADNVYAIGDIAAAPDPASGQVTRIEHWNVSQNHGRTVGANIASSAAPTPFDKIPIFWSAQGQQLRYVGHAEKFDEVYIDGSADEMKFVAYYIKDGKVLAVSSMQRDPVAMQASFLMAAGKMPSASEIKSGKDLLTIEI